MTRRLSFPGAAFFSLSPSQHFSLKPWKLRGKVVSLHKIGCTSAKHSNKLDVLLSVCTIFTEEKLHSANWKQAFFALNRIQLALYFAIGKYLSQHTRKGVWGEGALAAISEQLRKELPGLRGFSETQMKDMRRFYEAWDMLDSNSAVATAEFISCNSAVATAELQDIENQIDIFHTLSITNIPNFPVEDFFKVPFTHHSAIISGTKS